LNKPAG